MWKGSIPHELEDLEHARIRGAKIGVGSTDMPVLPPVDNRRKRSQNMERTGNGKGGLVPTPNLGTPATMGEVPKENGIPIGKRLRGADFEASKQFGPNSDR